MVYLLIYSILISPTGAALRHELQDLPSESMKKPLHWNDHDFDQVITVFVFGHFPLLKIFVSLPDIKLDMCNFDICPIIRKQH